MRELTDLEIEKVAGMATTAQYQLPAGAHLTTQLMPNNSTTVSVTLANGGTYSWNSGTYLACTLVGAGVGSGVWAFSGGNGILASLGGFMASEGCSAAMGGLDQGG